MLKYAFLCIVVGIFFFGLAIIKVNIEKGKNYIFAFVIMPMFCAAIFTFASGVLLGNVIFTGDAINSLPENQTFTVVEKLNSHYYILRSETISNITQKMFRLKDLDQNLIQGMDKIIHKNGKYYINFQPLQY